MNSHEPTITPTQTFVLYRRRWLVLLALCLLTATNSILWIGFAPITSIVQSYYGVSEIEVYVLAVIFFVAYIPGSIFASVVVQKWGIREVLRFGGYLHIFGCALRCLSSIPIHHIHHATTIATISPTPTPTPTPTSTPTPTPVSSQGMFYLLLVGQIFPAFAQPFFTNLPVLIAVSWFGVDERDLAVVLGAASNILGIAIGQVLPAGLVIVAHDIPRFLLIQLAISVVTLCVCFISVRSDLPPSPPTRSAQLVAKQRTTHTQRPTQPPTQRPTQRPTQPPTPPSTTTATTTTTTAAAATKAQTQVELQTFSSTASSSSIFDANISSNHKNSTSNKNNKENNRNPYLTSSSSDRLTTDDETAATHHQKEQSRNKTSALTTNIQTDSNTTNSNNNNNILLLTIAPNVPSSSLEQLKRDVIACLKNRQFCVLMFCFGVGAGLLSAISTLIENIVSCAGYSSTDAGLLGGVLVVSGLISCVVVGLILDRTKKYNPTLKVLFILAVISLIGMFASIRPNRIGTLFLTFAVAGGVMVPILPASLEAGAECTYPISEDVSSGLLMSASQIVAIILVFLLGSLVNLSSKCHTIFVPHAIAVVCIGLALAIVIQFYNGKYLRLTADKEPVALVAGNNNNNQSRDHDNI